MLDIVNKRTMFFLIAGIAIVICIASLLFIRLKPGIDFSSGSMLTVSFEQEVSEAELKQEMASLGYGNAIVQTTGEGYFIIRSVRLEAAEKTQLRKTWSAPSVPWRKRAMRPCCR